MRIGQLAAQSGVSTRALRYYEEQKLLASERTTAGQRTYADSAVDRVKLIQQLYAAGLSSATIRGLLPCVYAGVSTPDARARLAAERERIDNQVRQLIATRDRLDAVIRESLQHAGGSSTTDAPLAGTSH